VNLQFHLEVSRNMEEDLAKRWGKFSLLDEENTGVSIQDSELVPLVSRGKFCLVGKLLADRVVAKDFLRGPLLRMWKPGGPVSFKGLGENIFLVEFDNEWDKTKVMEGRPWLFDGNLVSLNDFDGLTPPNQMNFDKASFWVRMYNLPLACMGRDIGVKIGSSVGVVKEVDLVDDDIGWGEYLRVRILLDLKKPLARGRLLHLQSKSLWIAFKYEKLPKFCFKCGVIKHGSLGCGIHRSRRSEEEDPYGNWLRVSYPNRRGSGGEYNTGRKHTEKESGFASHGEPVFPAHAVDNHGDASERALLNDSDAVRVSNLSQDATKRTLPFVEGPQDPRKSSKSKSTLVPNIALTSEIPDEKATDSREIPKIQEDSQVNPAVKVNMEVSGGGNSGISSTKFIGSWDSGLGRMVWESLDHNQICLVREPHSTSYFPHVARGTQDGQLNTLETSHPLKALSSTETQRALSVAQEGSPRIDPCFLSSEISTGHPSKPKIPKTPGLKRARSGNSEAQTGGLLTDSKEKRRSEEATEDGVEFDVVFCLPKYINNKINHSQ
jgi:hypothetical protein